MKFTIDIPLKEKMGLCDIRVVCEKGKPLELRVEDNDGIVEVNLERSEVTSLRDSLSFFLNE